MKVDDTPGLNTLGEGGLKLTASEFSDEVRALLGKVITGLLLADIVVTPEKLIQTLHQLSENTTTDDVSRDCLQLIQQLMKKMH